MMSCLLVLPDRGEDWLQAPEFIREKINFFLNFKHPGSSVGQIQNRSTELRQAQLPRGQ